MIVISDTSPLLNLDAVGRLELLHAVHGRVVVPQAVFAELAGGGESELKWGGISWLEVRTVSDRTGLQALQEILDLGEAEAILLGVELAADLVLIDETTGRLEARKRGLRVTGVVGTLLAAKSRGLLPMVRPVLDELRTEARFWLSDAMYSHALELAGET